MAPRSRTGFTLVELLVVIVIISMLAGISVPAVMMARARARQNTCLNNSRQIGQATQSYATMKREMPPWRSKVRLRNGTSDEYINVSWAVIMMPNLGEPTIWNDSWRNAGIPLDEKQIRQVPVLMCPDDESTYEGPLSYAANCGWWGKKDSSASEFRCYWGLFPDAGSNLDGSEVVTKQSVRTESIKDGATNTAMYLENLQCLGWASRNAAYLGDTNDVENQQPGGVGVVWVSPDGSGVGDCGNSQQKPVVWPNKCYDQAEVEIAAALASNTTTGVMYARPSSRHSGGFHMTMADGSVKFIDDGISRLVYLRYLMPDDTTIEKQMEDIQDIGW